jgi:hypothetical protein
MLLVYAGRKLESGQPLMDYDIVDNSLFYAIVPYKISLIYEDKIVIEIPASNLMTINKLLEIVAKIESIGNRSDIRIFCGSYEITSDNILKQVNPLMKDIKMYLFLPKDDILQNTLVMDSRFLDVSFVLQ